MGHELCIYMSFEVSLPIIIVWFYSDDFICS